MRSKKAALSMFGTHHQSMEPSEPTRATLRPSPSAAYRSSGSASPFRGVIRAGWGLYRTACSASRIGNRSSSDTHAACHAIDFAGDVAALLGREQHVDGRELDRLPSAFEVRLAAERIELLLVAVRFL